MDPLTTCGACSVARVHCTQSCVRSAPRCCSSTRDRSPITRGTSTGLYFSSGYEGLISFEYRIVNLDVKCGKVAVGGDGNAPISWTARKDIARFLAHVLVHSPASRLQNQILRLEGDRAVCSFLCFSKNSSTNLSNNSTHSRSTRYSGATRNARAPSSTSRTGQLTRYAQNFRRMRTTLMHTCTSSGPRMDW